MGTADKIRFFRLRAGKSAHQVAAELGLNDAWYRDLESHDDELTSTLTMFQALQLASLLSVRLPELVADTPPPREQTALLDVPSMIKLHTAQHSISVEEFERQLGWELQEFLESPVRVAAELPIRFLQDLSAALGIDWLTLLPEEDAH